MFIQAETIYINNPKATKLITNNKLMFYLEPFFLSAQTLTEAANTLDVPLNTYFYWVKRFLEIGLIVISHEEERSGSNIKYYITPAKQIIIKVNRETPTLKSYYDFYTEQYNINDKVAKAVTQSLQNPKSEFGISLRHIDGDAGITTNLILYEKENIENTITMEMLKPNSAATLAIWRVLNLTEQNAKELQAKLKDLIYEYDKKLNIGEKPYFIQVAMAPEQ